MATSPTQLSEMGYYDVLIIGSIGRGKTTTTDKLLAAKYDYKSESVPLGDGDVEVEYQRPKYSDITVWLGAEIQSQLKVLMYCPNPHLEIDDDVQHVSTDQSSSLQEAGHHKFRLLSNETSKIRILDAPGFCDGASIHGMELLPESPADSLNMNNLDIMRSIVHIQSTLAMKFKRVLYFLPSHGPLERASVVLKLELKCMARYFDRSIFKSMIVVATVPSTISKMGLPDDRKFSAEDAELTKKIFKVALEELFPMSDESLPDPPLIFISQTHTCEEILMMVQNASVAEEELTLRTTVVGSKLVKSVASELCAILVTS